MKRERIFSLKKYFTHLSVLAFPLGFAYFGHSYPIKMKSLHYPLGEDSCQLLSFMKSLILSINI